MDFQHLLSPVPVESFFASSWQRAPLYIPHQSSSSVFDGDDKFSPFFMIDDLQELWQNAADNKQLTVVADAPHRMELPISSGFYAAANRLHVIARGADRFSQPLFSACEALQTTFPFVSCHCIVTSGVDNLPSLMVDPTPAGVVEDINDAQRMEDDVFVVQIFGQNHCRVLMSSHPITRNENGNDTVIGVKGSKEDQRASPTEQGDEREKLFFVGDNWEGTLDAGDVLYLPRGCSVQKRGCPSSIPPQQAKGSSSCFLAFVVPTSSWSYGELILAGMRQMLQQGNRTGPAQSCPDLSLLTKDKETWDTPKLEMVQNVFESLMRESIGRGTSSSKLPSIMEAGLDIVKRDVTRKKLERVSIYARKNRSSNSAAHFLSFSPCPCPVRLSSSIMWNSAIDILAVDSNFRDPKIPSLKFLIQFGKATDVPKEHQGSRPSGTVVGRQPKSKEIHHTEPQRTTMVQAVSLEVFQCLLVLNKKFNEVPCAVAALPMADNIGRLCVAVLFIRNEICLRVT